MEIAHHPKVHVQKFPLLTTVSKVTEQEKALAGLHWFSNMSEHLDQQLLSLEESKDTEQHPGNNSLT